MSRLVTWASFNGSQFILPDFFRKRRVFSQPAKRVSVQRLRNKILFIFWLFLSKTCNSIMNGCYAALTTLHFILLTTILSYSVKFGYDQCFRPIVFLFQCGFFIFHILCCFSILLIRNFFSASFTCVWCFIILCIIVVIMYYRYYNMYYCSIHSSTIQFKLWISCTRFFTFFTFLIGLL